MIDDGMVDYRAAAVVHGAMGERAHDHRVLKDIYVAAGRAPCVGVPARNGPCYVGKSAAVMTRQHS